jgi:anti-sigma-K factor RskA
MTHTDFEQLAAGYVLGALEPDDENAFQRHLEGCATCAASVRELEAVVGKLAYSATPVEPPPSLRASIRREVAATARPRGARATGPAAAARDVPRLQRRRWTTTLVGRLAVAASIIALLAMGFWNLSLQDQNDRYRQRVAAFEQAGRLLNDPAAETIRLSGSAGRATALVSSPQNRGVMIVEDLPPLRAGRVYEVWGIPQGAGLDKALPGGVFRPSRGVALVSFELAVQPSMSFGVTEEPGPAGSRSPTSDPVLTGAPPTRA